MPDEEIEEILSRGFSLLSLSLDKATLASVTHWCYGYPYVAHLLGLHIARAARGVGTDVVTDRVIEVGLRDSVDEFGQLFDAQYDAARERTGSVRPRQRLLHGLKDIPTREFEFQDVITAYKARYPGSGPSYEFLNSALGKLRREKHGATIKRRGTSRPYRYSFANPLMRAYLSMLEDSGRLPHEVMPTAGGGGA